MTKITSRIRLPEALIDALDRAAAALGLTRSRLIIQAVERAIDEYSTWSPAFLEAIKAPRPELEEAVDTMMDAIRARRSRNEAPSFEVRPRYQHPLRPDEQSADACGSAGEAPRAGVATSQVTIAEIEFGLRNQPVSKRRSLLQAQWGPAGRERIRLPWDDPVRRSFGEQKARPERSGKRMSDFYLAIAAHAIAFGLIFVTEADLRAS
jgi:predicted nucleic acid-binding protein/predicted DNA-binding protein